MTSPAPLLEIEQVSKRFGRLLALRSVDFHLQAGECVALLGANGAGKTTLLRIIATLSQPTRGGYRAFGVDAAVRRREVRARIGVVSHQPFVYPELTCRENLRFSARMYEIEDEAARIDEILAYVGLSDRVDRAASTLSRGLLQRLDLARALLHRPVVLILDEPDTGLDASGRHLLQRIITSQVEAGGAVVVTTHAIERALSIADRVVTLRDGVVSLEGAVSTVSVDVVEAAILPVDAAVA
ncbi:MAG: heme ABC exporter ATP-binding protein CcmA [Chloroflexota bacterium]